LEKLNLQSLIYEANLPTIINALDEKNKLDLNKYGDAYLDNSLAQLISKLEADIKIDARQGSQLDQDNIQLTAVKRLLEILFKENPVTFESIEATDNYGEAPKTYALNNGLVRQLISNVNQPKIFTGLIGLKVSGDSEQKITITTNSFLGALLKMLYPSLPEPTSQTEYQMSDLNAADESFTAGTVRALLNFLSSLLRGRNYTYLIQPIVTDNNA
jgi:hypothetical protein